MNWSKTLIPPILVLAVILTFQEPAQPTTCPTPGPIITRNTDGTYTRAYPNFTTLAICYSSPATHREEWTDLPEKGGTFIRSIENTGGMK